MLIESNASNLKNIDIRTTPLCASLEDFFYFKYFILFLSALKYLNVSLNELIFCLSLIRIFSITRTQKSTSSNSLVKFDAI